MHGDPVNLFLFYLAEEIDKVKNLPTLMREQSLSVRVLQFVWNAYDEGVTLGPFVKYLRSLSDRHVAILKDQQKDEKKRKAFKEKALSHIRTLFSASSLPLPICVLCYRTHLLICSKVSDMDLGGVQDLSHWTVSSLIFLRFLVPSIAQFGSDGSFSEGSKKASIEMGRVIMKLCCGLRFKSAEFSNELLDEMTPMFAEFCRDILAIGESAANADIVICSKDLSDDEEWQRTKEDRKALYEFLCTYGIFIPRTCRRMLEKDRDTEKDDGKEGECGEGKRERKNGLQVVEDLVERLKTRLCSEPLVLSG